MPNLKGIHYSAPSAYSILAYGQSNDPESPHHSDQASLFVGNKMKTVAYTEEAIL